ncbi:MAG: hypothetical protein GC179_17320 [Anaerolineaceae bacterium]|nr:hypothetical protein [Anaerolineaceae bacterium]
MSLYVGISLGIVACEGTVEPTETPAPTPTSSPAPIAKRISANLSGVQINMRVPPGWNGRQMDDGILIAERKSSIHNPGKLMGMQVYIFVHALNDFPSSVSTDSHPARRILQKILSQPALVGDSAVTDPEPFTWDGNDAAYYLVNDTNENVSLIMAVVIANQSQLVAINISCPSDRAESIRESLPELLSDLWVNNALMSFSGVDALPDPLIFPRYKESMATPTASG